METFGHTAYQFVRQHAFEVFPAIVLYCVLNALLSEIAGRVLGRPAIWFVLFMLLPGLSHLFFALLLIRDSAIHASRKVRRDVMDRPGSKVTWLEERPFADGVNISVTPFGPSPDPPDSAQVAGIMGILSRRRDLKLDELIEFELWPQARELAQANLRNAILRRDREEWALYKAYLELLEIRTPEFRGLKEKEESG